MMFFNPLFLQSISDAGVQTQTATNKLSNSKYLFSDIIKVFNESDPTTPGAVLPESTSVSSAPEIFSFQSSDMSAKVDFEIPKVTEGTQEQSILELLSTILSANATPATVLSKTSNSSSLSEATPEVKPDDLSGIQEFVVESKLLPQLLSQLLSVSQIADAGTTKTLTAPNSLPSVENKFEVLISGLLKKLDTDGEATIQLEKTGQNIQFKISKIDEMINGKGKTFVASTQIPTTVASADVTNSKNYVSANSERDVQSGLKESVKEISTETGKQNILNTVVSDSNTIKFGSEENKNISTNSVAQSRNIDLELDKLISQAIGTGTDVTADNVPTDQSNSNVKDLTPATIDEQSGIVSELKSTETKILENATEVQSVKNELLTAKKDEKPIVTQVQTNTTEVQSTQTELKSIKNELPLVENNFVKQSESTRIENEIVGSDSQINKVLNSQLNLNSERVLKVLEVKSSDISAPKNLNSYKIVMQVGEKQVELSTAEKNVDVTDPKQTETFQKSFLTTEEKNQVNDKPETSYSVKTILDSIKQVLKNESSANSDNVFENKKTNNATVQNKVEASDINLLNRLAQSNSKLSLEKSSTTPLKHFVEEKNQITLDKNQSSFANELTNKSDENTFVKKTSTAEAGKEISSLKFAGTADQKVMSETKLTEPQTQNHPAQINGKQEVNISEAAPVLNEPLIEKSKPEGEAKKNSPEIQKVAVKSEIEKPVAKTLLTDKEAGADIHQHQPAQTESKDIKHDAAKNSPEAEGTKTAEIQHNVSTNHQANEIKNSLPKEKVSAGNFQLPEKEKQIKSFELSKEISKIIESGTSQKVVLKLLPEALGKVKLTLEVGGDVIHAKAEVENESVKQIIQTNTETLKQTLSQNGLQLASFNISLTGSDDKHQKAHGQKKRSNSFTSKTKIEKSVLPEAARKLGYNTYEYLA